MAYHWTWVEKGGLSKLLGTAFGLCSIALHISRVRVMRAWSLNLLHHDMGLIMGGGSQEVA